MRFKKFTKEALYGLTREGFRESSKFKNDVDLSLSHNNYNSHDDSKAMRKAFRDRLKELKKDGVAVRDSAKFVGSVTHMPRPLFAKHPEKTREFFEAVVDFNKMKFGEKNVVGFTGHVDEIKNKKSKHKLIKAPHIHIWKIPEVESRKNGKKTVSVASKLTPKFLQTYHDELDDFLEKRLGTPLARTQNGSTKSHHELEEYKILKEQERDNEKQAKLNELRASQLDEREKTIKTKENDLAKRETSLNASDELLKIKINNYNSDYANLLAFEQRLKDEDEKQKKRHAFKNAQLKSYERGLDEKAVKIDERENELEMKYDTLEKQIKRDFEKATQKQLEKIAEIQANAAKYASSCYKQYTLLEELINDVRDFEELEEYIETVSDVSIAETMSKRNDFDVENATKLDSGLDLVEEFKDINLDGLDEAISKNEKRKNLFNLER